MKDMKNVNEEYVLFLDKIERQIIGKKIIDKSDSETWKVKNPLVVHTGIVNNQISIQFFPILFRELIADKDEGTSWNYHPKDLTICDEVMLDARFIAQYENVFAPVKNMPPIGMPPQGVQSSMTPPSPTTKPSVIKLFDD